MKRGLLFLALVVASLPAAVGVSATHAATPVGTLLLSSASGAPGVQVDLRGHIPTDGRQKVHLQRLDGKAFVTIADTRTDGRGRFVFTTHVPDDRSTASYRVRSDGGFTKTRTVVTGTTTRLTMDPDPTKYPEDRIGSGNSAISGDGRWIAFVSQGGIYLLDRLSGIAKPITDLDIDAAAPSLSTDGRFVAYVVGLGFPTSQGLTGDIVVLDRKSGTTTPVTSDGLGNVSPSISGDGSRVAYVRLGQARPYDVFLWERGRGGSIRVTRGNASSDRPDLSADGKLLVFTSSASDLVSDDRNPNSDVFMWNTRSHPREVRRLTHGISRSTYATVSSDGRFVALVSTGPPVKGNVGNPYFGVYLRDRTSGMTRRITVASARAMTAEISDNGNHVVYRLRRNSASPISGLLHIWDRNTGTTTMLPNSPPPQVPRVSADGTHVVFQGVDPDPIYPPDVYLWDRTLMTG